MITIEKLMACGVRPTQARAFAEPLASASLRFNIITKLQVSGFITQALHESEMLTHLEENLNYSSPVRIAEIFRTGFDLNRDRRISADEIELAKGYVRNPKALANRAYANRNGNGDEASGDGWDFRGSGPFQLTGRGNFQAFSDTTGIDYVSNPSWVREDPRHGSLAAGWFWAETGCNDLMSDASGFDTTTKRVNGPAMLGAAPRRVLLITCMSAFGA